MAEYIEREAVVRELNKTYDHMNAMGAQFYSGFMNAVHRIKYFPAADVAPVRHGRWIDAYPDIEPNPMCMYGICSECGFEQGISKYLNYCPNCGAKMESEE